jgi:hypothetical protein
VERNGLAAASLLTALPLPIVASILLATIRINIQEPQFDFQAYAMQTIGLFLLMIFVVPLSTIFSLVSGYVAFRQSLYSARKLAIASCIITAIGLVIVIIFAITMQGAGTSPPPDPLAV